MKFLEEGRRYWIVLAAIVAACAIGIAVWQLAPSSTTTQKQAMVNFRDPATGISLSYPEDLKPSALTEADRKDKIILRLSETTGEPLLMTLRYEEGLRKVGFLARRPIIDILADNAIKTLPNRFTGPDVLSQEKLEISGKPGFQLTFEYNGPSKERIRQKLLIIAQSDDRAFYLSVQSKQNDFELLDRKYFNLIFTSAKP